MKKLLVCFLSFYTLSMIGMAVEDIITYEPAITQEGYIKVKAVVGTKKNLTIKSKGTAVNAFVRVVRFSDTVTPQKIEQEVPLQKEVTVEYDDAGHWPTSHYRIYCVEYDSVNDIELRVHCDDIATLDI